MVVKEENRTMTNNVIQRRTGQDQLRNRLARAALLLDQRDHPRHDDGGRHGTEHSPEDCSLQNRDAKYTRSEENNRQQLKESGQEGHQQRRTADFAEIIDAQREPGLDQDDDQRHAPKIGGDAQDGRVKQAEHIGSKQHAGEQHADDARQTDARTERGCGQTDKKDERKRSQHKGYLRAKIKPTALPKKQQKPSA